MKNKLQDLTDHLFAQIERLSDEKLADADLRDEIARAGALDRMANRVIDIGNLALDAARVGHDTQRRMPRLLGLNQEDA